MMRTRFGAVLVGFAMILATLTGACVQMPTEKQSVTDLRPQVSFKAEDVRLREAHIFVDGLDMGRVGDYLEGQATLRVLPGTHTIRILLGREALVDEKIYLGDGVTRSFLVK